MKLVISEDKTKIILKEASHEEWHQLKLHLVRTVENHHFKKRMKMGLWDGTIDHFHNGIMRFGLWKEIMNCCKEHGYKFDVDKSTFPFDLTVTQEDVFDFCTEYYDGYKVKPTDNNPDGIFMPYDYQIEAVYKALKFKYGLLEVATSGGKSLIFGSFLFYILKNINPDAKTLLIVPRMSLVTQFYDDLVDYNMGYNKEQQNPFDLRIEELFSDKPRKVRDGLEPNIYISTYQSLVNYPPEFFKQFDVVVTDEAHSAKNASLDKILAHTFGYAQYRIGLSGTFPLEKTAELLSIESLMGPKLITVKARTLMDAGLVTQIKINAVILNYNDHEFAEIMHTIKKNGDGKKAYLLEKEYAQKSLKRMMFFRKLVDKFKDNSLILFHNIDYGMKLFEYLRDNIQDKNFYYIDGSTSKDKREVIKALMKTVDEKPKVLIASYGTFATGISINSIYNVVFADSFKSAQIVLQSIGRGLRLHKGKTKLVLFDIVDRLHMSFTNILYNQYVSRRDKIYKVQDFPVTELKIKV